MAVTGLMLLGFVIAHLLGNLLVFAGPAALNAYAEKLRHLGKLLWAARIILITAVLLHIWTAIKLSIENRKARPIGYHHRNYRVTTVSARAMGISGILLLAFIIYHLLHFTFGYTHPEIAHLKDSLGRHDVYSMVILGFQNVPIAASYMVAIAFLALHLSHGFASSFQSLGLAHESTQKCLLTFGRLLALLIFIGYASIPFSIWMGWVSLQKGLGT